MENKGWGERTRTEYSRRTRREDDGRLTPAMLTSALNGARGALSRALEFQGKSPRRRVNSARFIAPLVEETRRSFPLRHPGASE